MTYKKEEDAGVPAKAYSVAAEKPANRPVKSYRCGNFSGAIWSNEKDTKEGSISFLTASLRRSWKDKTGSWRDETVNLRKNDVAKAILLLSKLQEEMFFSEAEDNE
ncbi:MAG: hypothetical protein V1659_05135 [Candidatus Woesearchaeota archaeon]